MAVTLNDVARKALVSVSTVSRVVNGIGGVSDVTQLAVLKAVKDLNYRPNRMARGLKTQRGSTVALLVADIEQHWYASLTREIQAVLAEQSLDLMLIDLQHDTSKIQSILRAAGSMGLFGVGFAASEPIEMDELEDAAGQCYADGIKVFCIGQDVTASGVASVMHDDDYAAAIGVEHLFSRGCRDILYIGRANGSVVGNVRYQGFAKFLEKMTSVSPKAVFIESGYRYEAGYNGILRAQSDEVHFDGILAATDEIAIGAMAALADSGRRVSEDVAVVGFGGLAEGLYVRPSLTTLAGDPQRTASEVQRILSSTEERNSSLQLISRELLPRASSLLTR